MQGHKFVQRHHKVMVILKIFFQISGDFPEVLPGKDKVDVSMCVFQTADITPLIRLVANEVHLAISLSTKEKHRFFNWHHQVV